ncbi:MAG: phosphate/phosphite/phosphonate ABC transporter substrate-binding protein [Gammaproteobacteria bacterium]|nr:phosphate/phosphite/phosphonate ABC transporter substrate-binding protein [Gammaproteobacteria bacterium]MDH5653948.1 phosphate/phosphite/phosphonate ABC transporter substrate-binding protein [Gammaproteobacteria bacterium]
MKKLLIAQFCLLLMLTGLIVEASAAGLILTAPPRETKEAGETLYGPLARHFTELLGVDVSYQHPGNWLNYQRNMRDDKYDIVFDGPHFISWRMVHLKHDVLVKLPGTLEFYVVAQKSDNSLESLDQLVGKKICGISPPNLSTLTVLDRFRNPVRQPVLKGINGGMHKVFQAFKDGKCEAAVLRSGHYKKKITQQERDSVKILFHSAPLPNQAISVSSRVSDSLKKQIIRSLTLGKGVKESSAIVKRFGGKQTTSFIAASRQEYTGHNTLLEGVIFGW